MKNRANNQNSLLNPKGGALLMVLLVIGLLSGIVISSLTILNNYAKLESSKTHEMDALILAYKGISYSSHPLILRDDPLLEYKSDDGSESYIVTVELEASRIDINYALKTKDKVFLRNLFTTWGLDIDRASALVDAMVDWVDENDVEELNGAEAEYYISEGYNDRPYNSKFKKLKDLRLVRGFLELESLKPDWANYLTVWSGEKININETSLDVLVAATSQDINTVQQFLDIVRGEDGVLGNKDDQVFTSLDEAFDTLGVEPNVEVRKLLSSRLQIKSNTKRMFSVAEVAGTRKEVLVVIKYLGKKILLIHKREQTVYQKSE